jgi:sulfate permease, SulP family
VVLLISLVGVYLALLVQFNNAVKALLVFAAAPYGAIGALFALAIMGTPFGFMAFLGVASLIGVIVSQTIRAERRPFGTIINTVVALLPQATLAAVVIVYSIGLITPLEFQKILRIRRTEFIWAVIAFAGVVLVGTLKGILVAIIVLLLALVYQVANPAVHVLGRKRGTNVFRPRTREHPDDEVFPGLLMLRPEGRMFFANAEQMGQKIKPLIEAARPTTVVLDMSNVLDIEYTALKMLMEAEKRQRQRGVKLWLVGLNPKVLDMTQRSGLGETLGRERMFFNMEIALAKYLGEGVVTGARAS